MLTHSVKRAKLAPVLVKSLVIGRSLLGMPQPGLIGIIPLQHQAKAPSPRRRNQRYHQGIHLDYQGITSSRSPWRTSSHSLATHTGIPQVGLLVPHLFERPLTINTLANRSRSDAVASIVSMLVETDELAGDGDQTRGVREINIRHELAEDWVDPKWEPEPMDAAPGKPRFRGDMRLYIETERKPDRSRYQNSGPRRPTTSSAY